MKPFSQTYSLAHLSNSAVDNALSSSVTDDWTTTAGLLCCIGESDDRKRYLAKGYASMYRYCRDEFRMSHDVATKRINVARAARSFPAIFDAVAQGRLGLTSVLMLVPHLNPDSADTLLAAAADRTNEEVRLLIVGLAPKPDLPTVVQAVATTCEEYELAVRQVGPSECQQNELYWSRRDRPRDAAHLLHTAEARCGELRTRAVASRPEARMAAGRPRASVRAGHEGRTKRCPRPQLPAPHRRTAPTSR